MLYIYLTNNCAMIRKFISIGILSLFVACSGGDINKDEKAAELIFDKLIGTWQLAGEDQFEQWRKNPDGSYSSQAFSVTGKDTVIMEDVNIVNENGKWNFITLVKGQNKGKAVTFTSTIFMDTLVQFENPAHDFPRMINYRLVSPNNLQAFIGGTSDTIYFNFKRIVSK